MKTHFEPRCLMVPLSNAPCPSCDGYGHACAGKPGHTDPHRCECGYEWEERRLRSLAVRHGFSVRRWAARAAVLLVCASGFWGYYSANQAASVARDAAWQYRMALRYFGYDCSFDSIHQSMVCEALSSSSPSTPAPTREEQ